MKNLVLSTEVVNINKVVSQSFISLIVSSHSTIQEIVVLISERRKRELLAFRLKGLLYNSHLAYLFLKFTFKFSLLIEQSFVSTFFQTCVDSMPIIKQYIFKKKKTFRENKLILLSILIQSHDFFSSINRGKINEISYSLELLVLYKMVRNSALTIVTKKEKPLKKKICIAKDICQFLGKCFGYHFLPTQP